MIYVDDVEHPFGRMKMCHMWADTTEELHAFAARLGLRREWFQCPPKASWEHYDVSKSVKAVALELGATLTDKYGPLEHVARLALKSNETLAFGIGRLILIERARTKF